MTRRLWPLIIAHAANNIFITLAETFPMISLTGS
jgi:membrane protease YdiL (CAAX protease family)